VKRKTLDAMFSVGGIALAGLLAVLTADLQKQLSTVTAQRELLFKGETLRGLLLTSFGFSVFGVKGEQVATVAYLVAGLLVLLSMAGLAHAFRTSRNETTAALDHPYGRVAVEHRVGV